METVKTGSKIGRLTVEESTKQRRNGYVVWKCRCQCGREILADSRTLDLHVQRLRRKMGWEENLVAVYKVGYRLEI